MRHLNPFPSMSRLACTGMASSTQALSEDSLTRQFGSGRPRLYRSCSLDRARPATRITSHRRCLSNEPTPRDRRRVSGMGHIRRKAITNTWRMDTGLLLSHMKRYAHDPTDLGSRRGVSNEALRQLYLAAYADFTRESRQRVAVPGTIYAQRPILYDIPEIRLLRLEPQQDEHSPLRCSTIFWPFPLSATYYRQPPYYALSYRWSPPTPGTFLVVDGIEVNVSDDLALALRAAMRHVVPSGAPLIIWVDAICINQQDDFERTFQVAIMNHIYSCCRGTFIWLGAEADNSGLAIDMINEVSKAYDEWYQQIMRREIIPPEPSPLQKSPRHRSALAPFLSRSYWERLWIVQEVLLSDEKLILCGDGRLDWVDLQKFLIHQSVYADDEVLATLQTVGSSMKNLVQMDKNMNEKRQSLTAKLSLLEALVISRNRKCTDPKDHIYGVLGITTTRIAPKYQRSVHEVWTLGILTAIEEDRSLNVLSLSHLSPDTHIDLTKATGQQQQPPLPGWIPDLSQQRSLSGHILYCMGEAKTRKCRFEVFGPPQRPAPREIGAVKTWDDMTNTQTRHPLRMRVSAVPVDKVRYCHASVQRGDILRAWKRWCSYLLKEAPEMSTFYESDKDKAIAFVDAILLYEPPPPGETRPERRVAVARSYLMTVLTNTTPDTPDYALNLDFECKKDFLLAVLQPLRAYMDVVHAEFTIFYTERGYVGMGVRGVEPGDKVCLVGGCDVPLVLRSELLGEDASRMPTQFCFDEIFPAVSTRDGKALSAQRPEASIRTEKDRPLLQETQRDDYRVVGECCKCPELDLD